MARAMLWPRLVLPTPGGPTKHRIGPALRRQLADGQVLEDPLLDLLEIVMVLVEDAPRLGDIDRSGVSLAQGSSINVSR